MVLYSLLLVTTIGVIVYAKCMFKKQPVLFILAFVVYLVPTSVLLLKCVGAIARGESSIIPILGYLIGYAFWHPIAGIFNFISSVTLLLWIFIVPGHVIASVTKEKNLKKLAYVLNLILGVSFFWQKNPIYAWAYHAWPY